MPKPLGLLNGAGRISAMVNTPPVSFYEPSSATAGLDPQNDENVQLTFYTSEAWHIYFMPRQMAQVLERQLGAVLKGELVKLKSAT
jgi:hypothetical protein